MKGFAIAFLLACAVSLYSQNPTIGGYSVYYGHIHNHTEFSDGTGTVEQAYTYAQDVAKLDFFGVSDHSQSLTHEEYETIKRVANEHNKNNEFATFYGFEWSSSEYGHVAVINADDYCSHTDNATNTFSELSAWLSERDVVAFFCHPGNQDDSHKEFDHFNSQTNTKFVGMELWNKNIGFDKFYYNNGYDSHDDGLNYFQEAIEKDWIVGAAGADDNHNAQWGTENQYRLAILANSLSRPVLYDALKKKRFYSTLDKSIALSFKMNGKEMGSDIGEGTTTYTISAFDTEAELFSHVVLYKNGIEYKVWDIHTRNVSISESVTTEIGDNFYIKVTEEDGDEAISSPIWIVDQSQTNVPKTFLIAPYETTYAAPQTIQIEALADDTDGEVQHVRFYANGLSIATDSTSPYTADFDIPQNGIYSLVAQVTDNKGNTETSQEIIIEVGATTIRQKISSSMNDAEEGTNGWIYTESTDLEFVDDDRDNTLSQLIGLRFENISIPTGAKIANAYIQFTCDEKSSDNTELAIAGELTNNSSAFTTSHYNISSRAQTTKEVTWNPPAWNTEGERGDAQKTPDLKDIINEIIESKGIKQGGALSFLISGSGLRVAESFDGSTTNAPELTIEFETGELAAPPRAQLTHQTSSSIITSGKNIDLSLKTEHFQSPISSVAYYINNEKIGESSTYPFSIEEITLPNGMYSAYAIVQNENGFIIKTELLSLEIGIHMSTSTISKSEDDAEENPDGKMILTSTDIELIHDHSSNKDQTVGLRFENAAIPQDAVINNAYLQFTCDETDASSTTVSIYGEKSPNALSYTSSSYNISNRKKTLSKIQWKPNVWNTEGESGLKQRSPNVSSIIQEIVSQEGYSAQSAIAFILKGSGSRIADSYDGVPTSAAKLHVEYSDPAPRLTLPKSIQIQSIADGATFSSKETVLLSTNLTERDQAVDHVSYFVNNREIETVNSFPFEASLNSLPNGSHAVVAKAYDANGNVISSNVITITIGIVLDIYPVNKSTNDAEENPWGDMLLESTDLEIIHENSSGNDQFVGVRFENVTIPNVDNIRKAYIQFTTDEALSESADIEIYAHATDNSPAFTSQQHNISDREKTATYISWKPDAWNTVGESGMKQRTPDITKLLKELIEDYGYSSGNALSFIFTGSGSRVAGAYDDTSSNTSMPKLVIEYMEEEAPDTRSAMLQNPTNYASYNSGDIVYAEVAINDENSSSPIVSFYVNDNLVKTDSKTPYQFNFAPSRTGVYEIYAEITFDDGYSLTTNTTEFTYGKVQRSISSKISASNNDAEESMEGDVYIESTDLELAYDAIDNGGDQIVGLRFTDLGIPQGAKIDAAYIQFTTDEETDDECFLEIYGHDTGNSEPFTSEQFAISSRTKTYNYVTWEPSPWNTVQESGSLQQTPDLRKIVQEIVYNSEFTPASALTFIIEGTGQRIAESFDGSNTEAPMLYIEYSTEPNSAPSFVKSDESTRVEDYSETLAVYPTYVKENIFIELDKDIENTVTISKPDGSILYSNTIEETPLLILNATEYAHGTYFVSITNKKAIKTFTVFK